MIRTSKGEILNPAEGVNIPSCTQPCMQAAGAAAHGTWHKDFGDLPPPAGTSGVTCPTSRFAASCCCDVTILGSSSAGEPATGTTCI